MWLTVADILNKPVHKGDFAVEVEVEFDKDYETGLCPNVKGWTRTIDGSLRNGLEYVCDGPSSIPELSARLQLLAKSLKKHPVVWSNRCSTHIHVNVQELGCAQLACMGVLWYMFEADIVDWLAPTRTGNLFCLRAVDSETIPDHLRANLNEHQLRGLGRGRGDRALRYSGLNWASVPKFGSLEFRHLHGTLDEYEIMRFVDLIEDIRNFAKQNTKTLMELLQDASQLTPRGMWAEVFTQPPPPNLGGPETWESMRVAQDVAFLLNDLKSTNLLNVDAMLDMYLADAYNLDEGEL